MVDGGFGVVGGSGRGLGVHAAGEVWVHGLGKEDGLQWVRGHSATFLSMPERDVYIDVHTRRSATLEAWESMSSCPSVDLIWVHADLTRSARSGLTASL